MEKNQESGNGNDGTIYGATWTTGISGKALQFDGMDDYVDVDDDVYSATTGSMEAGLKLDDTSSVAYRIIGVGKSGNDYFVFDLQQNGKVIHFLKTGGTIRWKYRTIRTLSPGVWYHVVVTQEGIAPKTYINGDEVSTELESGSTSYNSYYLDDLGAGNKYLIGRSSYAPRYYFNGIIDEVAIYSRALTPEEIKAHYDAKRAGSPTTTLSLTKTASPHTIKQDQKTLIKITVENTGTTTIRDIEVVDTPPADFEFVSGDASAEYGSLKPKESRTFQYTLRSGDTGKFDLGQATATYADEVGNYHNVKSNTPMVEVM